MRVGLVLGAGGVVGASWLIGALEALESETGWSGASADRIVGTSAGSVIGALTAAGVSPEIMGAYATGKSLDGYAEAEARVDDLGERYTGSEYKLTKSLPPLGPGSWRLIAGTLRRPRQHNAAAVLAGWLPRGFVSTEPISKLVGSYVDGNWPEHPSYWAVAADYATGKRTVFGRDGAPPADVREAVAASCAIPGFYHPPKIAGRRYVDGGICSNSNLDVLAGDDLDLVVCLNPMSSLIQATGGSPADRFAALLRGAAGRRLGHEARKLRGSGTRVVILQPGPEDCRLMGLNLMSGARRLEVMEQARRSVARDLRAMRGRKDVVLPGRARRRKPVARKAASRKAA